MLNMELKDKVMLAMIEFDQGDAKRIQHFVKVFEFARMIGIQEKLEERTQNILEIAAILHDIGIHPAEEKYGNCNGKLQEQEGPSYAKELLEKLDATKEIIDRVCYLIAHHHTYHDIQGMDYQILVEADFIVNLYEDNTPLEAVKTAYEKIFRTESGRCLCKTIFGLS